jgi:hypothetical protein
MKKVLSIVLVLVVTTAGFAQKHSKDLRIGFKIEPNISWFNPVENGVKGDGSKVGINYGLMVDYEFADNYILSTGLLYTKSSNYSSMRYEEIYGRFGMKAGEILKLKFLLYF